MGSEGVLVLFKLIYQYLTEKVNMTKQEKEMKEAFKSEYGSWTNLTVININNFVHTHKLLTSYFFVTARHDLGLDFDKEHRGLSMNSQDPAKVAQVIERLKKIAGIEIGVIETIPNPKE